MRPNVKLRHENHMALSNDVRTRRRLGHAGLILLAFFHCGRVWLSNIGRVRAFRISRAAQSEDSTADGTDWDQELRRVTERLKQKELQEEGLSATKPLFRQSDEWTVERVELQDGVPPVGSVLMANPRSFLDKVTPVAAMRTGWMPSLESSRRDKARLPVVLITRRTADSLQGVLLGSWSGKLLGDMDAQYFMTRPLYIGGVNVSGLSMVHSYPEMPGSWELIDGLAASDDFNMACDWIENGPGSALRFKFFWNQVVWRMDEIDELAPEQGIWIPVTVSGDLLLREPDSSFEDPLWAQYALKAGGELKELGERFGLFPPDA